MLLLFKSAEKKINWVLFNLKKILRYVMQYNYFESKYYMFI